jgi:uncharacterized protein YggE
MLGMPSESENAIRTVTVRGYATIRAEPDEALLEVTLSAREDTPGLALSDVSARSNGLVALLDELGVAKADRSTTGVRVYEAFDYVNGERRSCGYEASSGVSVRLADPEVLGRLIAQATETLAAKLDGPHWRIKADNPVWLEAARQAAADGRRKAEAYAEGVGAKLGRLIQLVEPGSERVVPQRTSEAVFAASSTPMDSMPVERGEHDVAASINVTFALELD